VRVDLIARTSSSLAGVSPVRVAARSAVADQLGVHRAFRRALSGRARRASGHRAWRAKTPPRPGLTSIRRASMSDRPPAKAPPSTPILPNHPHTNQPNHDHSIQSQSSQVFTVAASCSVLTWLTIRDSEWMQVADRRSCAATCRKVCTKSGPRSAL
jgi:hypothetical protein